MKYSSKFPHLNLFILLSIIITSSFPLIDGYSKVSISFGVGIGGDGGCSIGGFNSDEWKKRGRKQSSQSKAFKY